MNLDTQRTKILDNLATRYASPFGSLLQSIILNPRTKNIIQDINDGDCIKIKYNSTTEINQLLQELKHNAIIQKHHLSNYINLIVSTIFSESFEPHAFAFDCVLIQYYSKPIIYFINEEKKFFSFNEENFF